jgi:hypothetical protein
MDWACGWMGSRNVYRIMVGKLGKQPLLRVRRGWENNIKMDIRLGLGSGRCIELSQKVSFGFSGVESPGSTVREFVPPRKCLVSSGSTFIFMQSLSSHTTETQ